MGAPHPNVSGRGGCVGAAASEVDQGVVERVSNERQV